MPSIDCTRRGALGLLGTAAALPALPAAARGSGDRPRFHIAAPPGGWINDPQRPILIDGVWNLWALYNPTPPRGGTAWRRWTSTDLVTWIDRGISIPRGTTPYGDVWTGSTVVDADGVAGFGAGAVIAIVTMPARDSGGENQSCALWYSRDGGASFAFHDIVLRGPGRRGFRDPSVFWHAPTRRWMLTLSEEGRIGFYASADLRRWRSVGGFASGMVGRVMECSHLFPLHLYEPDGTTKSDKWVLLVGGNGTARGFTVGTWYWVGDFDGTTFTPLRPVGRWLDGGADFYAATIWSDAGAADPLASAYAVGWMSNWDYVRQLRPINGYLGQLSLVRRISLRRIDGDAMLVSAPLDVQNDAFGAVHRGEDRTVGDDHGYALPVPGGAVACRVDLTVARIDAEWPREVRIAIRREGVEAASVALLFPEGVATTRRASEGFGAPDSEPWRAERRVACDFADDEAKLSLFVDTQSIEAFVASGQATLSQLIGAPIAPTQCVMTVKGGRVRTSNVVVRAVP